MRDNFCFSSSSRLSRDHKKIGNHVVVDDLRRVILVYLCFIVREFFSSSFGFFFSLVFHFLEEEVMDAVFSPGICLACRCVAHCWIIASTVCGRSVC